MIAIIDGAEIVWPAPIGSGTSTYASSESPGWTNRSRGTVRKASRTRGFLTQPDRTRCPTVRSRSAAQSRARPIDPQRAWWGHKSSAHAGTRSATRNVESTRVAAVTGRPAFTKSRIDTLTPSRDATCTTISLHAAPRIVAFPARVELAARASHSCVEPRGTTSAKRSTAGTLLIRFDRRAERPTSHASPPERPPRADVKPSWIAPLRPDARTPPRTTNRPMKNRMMPQSTFAIRARGVTVAKNGRKNKTNAPPERATRGSQSGVAEARNATDTAIVTPKVRAKPLR